MNKKQARALRIERRKRGEILDDLNAEWFGNPTPRVHRFPVVLSAVLLGLILSIFGLALVAAY